MVISVACPACSTSFPVDTNKVPLAGVNARCSICGHVFRVERPPEPAPEPELLPAFEAPAFKAEPEPAPPPTVQIPAVEAEAEPEPLPAPEAPSFDQGPQPGPWVVERDDGFETTGLDIKPLDVEPPAEAAHWTVPAPPAPPVAELDHWAWSPGEPATAAPPAPAVPQPPAPAPELPAPAPTVGSFSFGKRDPKDKARRLARVLVSDMIMYNPDRHQQALANGTLKEDFEDEIQKSWKEYVDQVGEEMATQNRFWIEALNDVLARGEQIF